MPDILLVPEDNYTSGAGLAETVVLDRLTGGAEDRLSEIRAQPVLVPGSTSPSVEYLTGWVLNT
jgi:hypothetical protein